MITQYPNRILPFTLVLGALLLTLPVIQPATAGGSLETGSMTTGRFWQTATLLLNGKVLAAGGYHDSTGDPALSSAELYDPATGTWRATGSMAEARYNHTAVLLPNGKVLVVGGQSRSGVLSSAELYDPDTGTWTTTGSMAVARLLHTAAFLTNGKVLVAGGVGSYTPSFTSLSSAELYDPATGTWTEIRSMAAARFSHTATLLSNGKVLVAGGYDFSGLPLTSAELCDPATGTWTVTGTMTAGRTLHTATLLSNGKVLVAGSYNENSDVSISSAEIYNPGAGAWTATSPMAAARGSHTAILLPNGRVLVAGGRGVFDMAGASTELYDPVTGTWTTTGALVTRRESPTGTLLLNGKVLLAGGNSSATELYDPVISSMTAARVGHTATLLPNDEVLLAGGHNAPPGADLYNPATRTWTPMASMTITMGRSGHTAILLPDGKVLVAGGVMNFGISESLSSAELFDPATGTWTPTGSMTAARFEHTAALLPDGKVLVAGGYDFGQLSGQQTGDLSSAELYAPAIGTWTTTSAMATARWRHTATLLPNGTVLIAGGQGIISVAGGTLNVTLSSAELYDPTTGTWTTTGALITRRESHTATLLSNGKVLAAGGRDGFSGASSPDAELYDTATGAWMATDSMTTLRYLHTATLLPTGKVLVAGGQGVSNVLSSAELYDPATGKWTATGSMTTARVSHAATLLPNGKVLVAGGQGVSHVLSSAELYDPAAGAWAIISLDASPIVNLTSPTAGATFIQGANLTISARISDNGGSITNVSFFSGTNFLGEVTGPPYSLTWSNLNIGTFTLTAHAIDNRRSNAISAPIQISVVTGIRFTSLAALADRSVRLSLEGMAGPNLQVEGSTDLINWSVLTNIVNPPRLIEVIDPNRSSAPRRFYRTVSPP